MDASTKASRLIQPKKGNAFVVSQVLPKKFRPKRKHREKIKGSIGQKGGDSAFEVTRLKSVSHAIN